MVTASPEQRREMKKKKQQKRNPSRIATQTRKSCCEDPCLFFTIVTHIIEPFSLASLLPSGSMTIAHTVPFQEEVRSWENTILWQEEEGEETEKAEREGTLLLVHIVLSYD
jgi:hypothetical protein